MFQIFNGSIRGLGEDPKQGIYLKMSVDFRKHLSYFKGAKLGVFISITLHADSKGWSTPPISVLKSDTGYDEATISRAVTDLCKLTIDGSRVLLAVQERTKGKFVKNRYLLFPSAEEIAKHEGVIRKPRRTAKGTLGTEPQKPNSEKPNSENASDGINHSWDDPSMDNTDIPNGISAQTANAVAPAAAIQTSDANRSLSPSEPSGQNGLRIEDLTPPISAAPPLPAREAYWRHVFFSRDDATALHILRQLEDGQARSFTRLSYQAPRFYHQDSDYLKRMVWEGLLEVVWPENYRITKQGLALVTPAEPAAPLPAPPDKLRYLFTTVKPLVAHYVKDTNYPRETLCGASTVGLANLNRAYADGYTICQQCSGKLALAQRAADKPKAAKERKPPDAVFKWACDYLGVNPDVAWLSQKHEAFSMKGYIIAEEKARLKQDAPLTDEQLTATAPALAGFVSWYEKECQGCSLPKYRKFQTWIGKWYKAGRPGADVQAKWEFDPFTGWKAPNHAK